MARPLVDSLGITACRRIRNHLAARLTPSESFILEQIQDMYGEQNTESNVFLSDMNEAVILVKDQNGIQRMMTALYDDGMIGSLKELRANDCAHTDLQQSAGVRAGAPDLQKPSAFARGMLAALDVLGRES